ncbi:hypothetical protein N7359_01430 [Stenotrophomonas maltophilia]|uniref:hypothetical protein n=1 Tax=Stenotrophomonas maltophilia TaxID=40324 RepID=UPI0024476B94|nr:hypothetical protein [Stenotrophomonas maltophilia]MDH0071202.1 hypothetical protein [Stenotrophomonas maltophilia]MDH0104201.1 hypothetical protein [Stenotrophomonas maltophilia]MDH0330149.1 hypothetical protein [Stenotrophomonas maltophilia]
MVAHHPLVFVTDKPSISRILLPRAQLRWPGRALYAVPLHYVGRYEFRYPRGLTYAELPFTGEPEWRPRAHGNAAPLALLPASPGVHESAAAANDLIRYGEVVYAAEVDHSGAVAFDVLMTEVLGAAAATLPRHRFSILALDSTSVDAALAAPGSTDDAHFQELLSIGRARRYFDFCYLVNAQPILGDALRRASGTHKDYWVSKFALQLLYRLSHLPAITPSEILQLMENWAGHGPQPAITSLGSAASRHAIVDQLMQTGLLIESADSSRLQVSKLGTQFLAQLHPDCEDADLPMRLTRWASQWPSSRPNIDRYLRTFFGKQKRLSRRPL